MSLEAHKPAAAQSNNFADLGGLMDHADRGRPGAQPMRFAELAPTPGAPGAIASDAMAGGPTFKLDYSTPAIVQKIQDNYKSIATKMGVDSVWSSETDGTKRQHVEHEILPGSDSRNMSVSDIVKGLSKGDADSTITLDSVWRAKNELFARAGRPFGTESLANDFVQMGYRPQTNYDFHNQNDFEIHNAQVLGGLEKMMRTAGVDQISGKALEALMQPKKEN
jgi:hypothetical protein